MNKKVIIVFLIIVAVIIFFSVRAYREKKDNEFMINDGKAGITAEVIERVPGIRYSDDITYRKGYKLIENNGSCFIYISDGPKGLEEDTIDVKQIRIEGDTVTIRVEPDYTGKADDESHGCVDVGVKLNKRPGKLIVKNSTEDEYSELKVLNLSDKVYWDLFTDDTISGTTVKNAMADIIADMRQNENPDAPEILVKYAGMGAMAPSGLEKLRARVITGKKYTVNVSIEEGKETISFEQVEN